MKNEYQKMELLVQRIGGIIAEIALKAYNKEIDNETAINALFQIGQQLEHNFHFALSDLVFAIDQLDQVNETWAETITNQLFFENK